MPPVPGAQGNTTGIWGYVHFKGSGSKPPLLFDCHFVGNDRENVTGSEAAFLSIDALGGVVWNTLFDGSQIPDGTSVAQEGMGGAGIHLYGWARPWTTQSTMGTLDTNGNVNVYFEDCQLLLWGQADVDNSARAVIRHSTMNGSGWQTHGFTSGVCGRHVEMYDNQLINTVNNRNFYRYFWLRGGTLVMTGNSVSNQNTGYGTPSLLNVGDNTNPSGAYPIAMAPGRGYWASHVADPIYLWGNTGGAASRWGVEAAWQSQVQLGRDIFVDSGAKPGVPGSGGTPWAKYQYPHPMRAVVESGGPAPTPTPTPQPTPTPPQPTPTPTPPPTPTPTPEPTPSPTPPPQPTPTPIPPQGGGGTHTHSVDDIIGMRELLQSPTLMAKPTPTPAPVPPGGAHRHSVEDIDGLR
jgi:hypothetical protein